MSYSINVMLDENREKIFRGTPLEKEIKGLFGNKLKAFQLEVPDDAAKTILKEFQGTRIDSRNFIEGIPVSLKRELFNEISTKMSISRDIYEGAFEKMEELKKEAKLESEFVPPP